MRDASDIDWGWVWALRVWSAVCLLVLFVVRPAIVILGI